MTSALVSKADLDNRRWAEGRREAFWSGAEEAMGALQDIRANWTDGLNISQLYPGETVVTFMGAAKGSFPIPLRELVAGLPDMSVRQLAEIAGVSRETVRTTRLLTENLSVEPPVVIGYDGKRRAGRVVGTTTAEVIEPDPPRGRPVPKRAHPDWWREVGAWLARARKEDARVLLELDARVHAAMSAAGLPLGGATE